MAPFLLLSFLWKLFFVLFFIVIFYLLYFNSMQQVISHPFSQLQLPKYFTPFKKHTDMKIKLIMAANSLLFSYSCQSPQLPTTFPLCPFILTSYPFLSLTEELTAQLIKNPPAMQET